MQYIKKWINSVDCYRLLVVTDCIWLILCQKTKKSLLPTFQTGKLAEAAVGGIQMKGSWIGTNLGEVVIPLPKMTLVDFSRFSFTVLLGKNFAITMKSVPYVVSAIYCIPITGSNCLSICLDSIFLYVLIRLFIWKKKKSSPLSWPCASHGYEVLVTSFS